MPTQSIVLVSSGSMGTLPSLLVLCRETCYTLPEKYCATTFGRQSTVFKSLQLWCFQVFKPVSECTWVLKGSSESALLLRVSKGKTAFTPLHFLFICFRFLKHTILHFSLPLLAEWHTLKQKCCNVVLSPYFVVFFSFRYHHLHLLQYEKKKCHSLETCAICFIAHSDAFYLLIK